MPASELSVDLLGEGVESHISAVDDQAGMHRTGCRDAHVSEQLVSKALAHLRAIQFLGMELDFLETEKGLIGSIPVDFNFHGKLGAHLVARWLGPIQSGQAACPGTDGTFISNPHGTECFPFKVQTTFHVFLCGWIRINLGQRRTGNAQFEGRQFFLIEQVIRVESEVGFVPFRNHGFNLEVRCTGFIELGCCLSVGSFQQICNGRACGLYAVVVQDQTDRGEHLCDHFIDGFDGFPGALHRVQGSGSHAVPDAGVGPFVQKRSDDFRVTEKCGGDEGGGAVIALEVQVRTCIDECFGDGLMTESGRCDQRGVSAHGIAHIQIRIRCDMRLNSFQITMKYRFMQGTLRGRSFFDFSTAKKACQGQHGPEWTWDREIGSDLAVDSIVRNICIHHLLPKGMVMSGYEKSSAGSQDCHQMAHFFINFLPSGNGFRDLAS